MIDPPIRVLVVDDAAVMRTAVAHILESDPHLQVAGTARHGLEAIEKLEELDPDVVTLDIDMPVMGGVSAIKHIMVGSPRPIVVLSSMIREGGFVFEALRLGVVDFIPKPSLAATAGMDVMRRQLVDRVKIASSMELANVRRVRLPQKWETAQRIAHLYRFYPLDYLVAVGTNISGPNTVIRILAHLSPTIPAALVVQQDISPRVLPSFVARFDEWVPWKVTAAQDGALVEQGTCYIGSCDHSLSVVSDANQDIRLQLGPPIDQPLDTLFSSVAAVFRQNAVGVLLSGVGKDGARGFADIKAAGGVTIIKDVRACVYPNLTDNALREGVVDLVLSDRDIPGAIEVRASGVNSPKA